MKQFGLIGKKLGHSYSKKYFEEKFQKLGIKDCSYELFPIDSIEGIETILAGYPGLAGLNVTIPYKESVIKYMDHLHESAQKTGAVNCISIKTEGEKKTLIGYNTDTFGFQQS